MSSCFAQGLADTYRQAAQQYRLAAARCSGPGAQCYLAYANYHDCLANQLYGGGSCTAPSCDTTCSPPGSGLGGAYGGSSSLSPRMTLIQNAVSTGIGLLQQWAEARAERKRLERQLREEQAARDQDAADRQTLQDLQDRLAALQRLEQQRKDQAEAMLASARDLLYDSQNTLQTSIPSSIDFNSGEVRYDPAGPIPSLIDFNTGQTLYDQPGPISSVIDFSQPAATSAPTLPSDPVAINSNPAPPDTPAPNPPAATPPAIDAIMNAPDFPSANPSGTNPPAMPGTPAPDGPPSTPSVGQSAANLPLSAPDSNAAPNSPAAGPSSAANPPAASPSPAPSAAGSVPAAPAASQSSSSAQPTAPDPAALAPSAAQPMFPSAQHSTPDQSGQTPGPLQKLTDTIDTIKDKAGDYLYDTAGEKIAESFYKDPVSESLGKLLQSTLPDSLPDFVQEKLSDFAADKVLDALEDRVRELMTDQEQVNNTPYGQQMWQLLNKMDPSNLRKGIYSYPAQMLDKLVNLLQVGTDDVTSSNQ